MSYEQGLCGREGVEVDEGKCFAPDGEEGVNVWRRGKGGGSDVRGEFGGGGC